MMEADGENGLGSDEDANASPKAVNGSDAVAAPPGPDGARSRMNDLPDEILHITQGFIPLSLLLTRLAQASHNALQEKVAELAKMPLPASAANGHAVYSANAADDSSPENLAKKGALAAFAQDLHAKWLKALVITEWSRKSSMVSKLIDLKFHLDQQRLAFDAALDSLVAVKRDLAFARMPSPDLKTALYILSTGTAPWLSDLNFIEPPPLGPEDQLKWINDLNTLLSLRLNLDDYDKLPRQFRNYEIGSGRVTFKVEAEFEVDLTIADEDFSKQFWFIDFRYAFTPAASSLSDALRAYLEDCVNEALGKDGLAGCYRFLHEFVLTSKINELKRQALLLARSSWAGTLVVEPLNRALAIQYWTSRTAAAGSKSWVLVAVSSGRKSDATSNAPSSSRIIATWYRDGKEVNDVQLELDVDDISAEALLSTVVGLHIESILGGIHRNLLTAGRFRRRECGMDLHISKSDPAASYLSMQIGYRERATVMIEPATGAFAIKPPSRFTLPYEHQLNHGRSPAEDGVSCLESIRCAMMEDELNRRGCCLGWRMLKSPLSPEMTRSLTRLREWTRTLCLQRDGWGPRWFIVVFLSLGGDEWWLLEVDRTDGTDTSGAIKSKARLPLKQGHIDLSDAFWSRLTLLATSIISQSIDIRELHKNGVKSRLSDRAEASPRQQVRLPSIDISLGSLFPSESPGSRSGSKKRGGEDRRPKTAGGDAADDYLEPFSLAPHHGRPKLAWAQNVVIIEFRGLEVLPGEADERPALSCLSAVVVRVQKAKRLEVLPDGMLDRDVSYDRLKGEFTLRMRRVVGEPMLEMVRCKIKAISRFVHFLEAVERAKDCVTSESVTLRQVSFCYGDRDDGGPETVPERDDAEAAVTSPRKPRWHVVLDLSQDEIDVKIEVGNAHLRAIDLMRKLVNSDGGIGALMAWLPASLSALEAVDEMESKWEGLAASGRGRLELSMKTLAWISITFNWPGPRAEDGEPKKRQVTLEAKMQWRRGELWWHVWRSDANAASDDSAAQALKPIWDGRGEDWLGLATGAAARPKTGVVKLLRAVDEAMRKLVGGTG